MNEDPIAAAARSAVPDYGTYDAGRLLKGERELVDQMREQERELAELIRECRYSRDTVMWNALMRCQDCDHRMIDHDEVAFRCLLSGCPCDQTYRGLSSYMDDRLALLGAALHIALGDA